MRKLLWPAMLLFNYAIYSQTSFIKEYPIYAIVDSTKNNTKNVSIEKLINISNGVLENVDNNGYGIRLKYERIIDTVSAKDSIDAYKMLDSMALNYRGKRVLYLTTANIRNSEGEIIEGTAFMPGTKLIVREFKDDNNIAYRIVHEFLHNLGVSHNNSIFDKDFFGDVMVFNSKMIHGNISERTKKNIWDVLKKYHFYDFKPVYD